MRIARAVPVGLVVAGLAFAPTAARAQKGGQTEIGPWAGLNFTTFSVSNVSGTFSNLTRFAVGGQLVRGLSKDFALRIGLLYSQRGADAGGGVSMKLDYLEIPVMVAYKISGQGTSVTPYVAAGGQFAIKLNCNVSAGSASVDCGTLLNATLPSTDVGINLGAGVAFPVGKAALTVDARYYIGLTNLASAAGGGVSAHNTGFSVGVGYMFRLGR